jgi:peptide/nickel transport system substrate-binding protein
VQFDTVNRAVPGTQKIAYVAYQNPGMVFNLRRKPWDDLRVRRAVHLAVDRQALEAAVSFGEGFIGAPSPIIPSMTQAGLGMQPDEYLRLPGWRQPKEQDLGEAKRLMAEAGLSGGLKTLIKYQQGSTGATRLAEPVASQLRSIGLEIGVQAVEDGVYLAQVEREGDFDLRVDSGVGGSLNPIESAHTEWNSKGSGNTTGVNDPELDRLTEAVKTELDEQKRFALFTGMQRRILENVYYIALPTAPLYQALQPWLHEFYGSFSANVSILNPRATWMEVDKLPEARRGF